MFGIYSAAGTISSVLFGRYGSKIGPKAAYNCCAVLQAICGLTFGYLTYIKNVDLFILLACILMAITGGADAVGWSASLAVVNNLFSEMGSKPVSYLEFCFGIGSMIGKIFGLRYVYYCGKYTK